jgi:hypothetical protein
VLEFDSDETLTSASELETHIQRSSVEQFPASRDIAEQSVLTVADKGPRHVPNHSSANAYAEEELIPTLTNIMMIISCPEIFFVDIEYTLMRKT